MGVFWWKYLDGSIWMEVFGWKYLDGSIWLEVFWWKYLDGSIWMEVFGWKYFDGSIWLEVFGRKYLDGQKVWKGEEVRCRSGTGGTQVSALRQSVETSWTYLDLKPLSWLPFFSFSWLPFSSFSCVSFQFSWYSFFSFFLAFNKMYGLIYCFLLDQKIQKQGRRSCCIHVHLCVHV